MMSGFGRRVVTAGVLAPLMIGAVLVLPTPVFAVALGGVILLAAWEWSRIIGWTAPGIRWAYTLAFVPVLGIAYGATFAYAAWLAVLALAMLGWLVATLGVVRFQRGHDMPAAWNSIPVRITAGLLVLVPPWMALIGLHAEGEGGRHSVIFFMVVIWAADTSAFLVGRRWGTRRLASRVSPGKSWEGAGAALLAGAMLAALGAGFLGVAGGRLLPFISLCMMVVAVSILGDLAESLCKRQAGMKDSGSLLPGHGGVLDRIDSMTSAAPFFVLTLQWLRALG
ncbi:MAG: phosphatidate cytidylyltransferase [Gammaproteobacteria bacterium]